MKRFPCKREGGDCTLQIFDSHDNSLAEFKTENPSTVTLYDQKNKRVQYRIEYKDQIVQIIQENNVVAEFVSNASPRPGTKLKLNIKEPKYGSDIEVTYSSATDFKTERGANTTSFFSMTSPTAGHCDISKGERRNFSFAVIALFVHWRDKVSNSESKSSEGSETESEKEKISQDESNQSAEDEEEEKPQTTTAAAATTTKQERVVPIRNPHSTRSKSPRVPGQSNVTSAANPRRDQSSNSVLNALLQKNKEKST